jgi:hypothetical protein
VDIDVSRHPFTVRAGAASVIGRMPDKEPVAHPPIPSD